MSEFTDISLPKRDKDGEYNMCKAVEEIKAEGTIDTLVLLVRDGLLDINVAAERAGMSLEAFEKYVTNENNF